MLPILWAANLACAFEHMDESKIDAVANAKRWQALLHYRQHLLGYKSAADDARFFLSPQGVKDPRAELLATLEKMRAAPTADINSHPQCQFPARLQFLGAQFPDWYAHLKKYDCPKLDAWFEKMQPQSASLIFPAAYLNSPSSMYGHTLFRINGKGMAAQEHVDNRLLAHSISYAADMPEDVGAFAYMIGGLFGGYPGHMYEEFYFDKINQYGDIENRDIWEYPIHLSPSELNFMLLHIWELQHVRFDYFFFDENCSLRLLDVLDVAVEGLDSAADFSTHAIPVDTVRALQKRNILGAAQYRPAVLSHLRAQAATFNPKEQDLIIDYTFGKRDLAEFANVFPDVSRRAYAMDFGYQYLRYNVLRKTVDKKAASKRSLALLSYRSKLPSVAIPPVPVPFTAEDGHKTARVALGAGYFNAAYLDFDIRPAFHDLLDNDAGYVQGAQLEFFVLKLRYLTDVVKNPLKLDYFKFVDVEAMSARDKFFFPKSWLATFGFYHDDLRGKYHDRFGVKAGRGLTWALGAHRLSVLALMDVNVASKFVGKMDAGVALKIADIYTLPIYSEKLGAKWQLSGEYWEYESHRNREGWHLAADLNWPLDIDNALRLSVKQHIGKNPNLPKSRLYELNLQHFF